SNASEQGRKRVP
ncbi:hypothetical protein D030_4032B, partial [Vibrio parahaemolyticus AQ3810]